MRNPRADSYRSKWQRVPSRSEKMHLIFESFANTSRCAGSVASPMLSDESSRSDGAREVDATGEDEEVTERKNNDSSRGVRIKRHGTVHATDPSVPRPGRNSMWESEPKKRKKLAVKKLGVFRI